MRLLKAQSALQTDSSTASRATEETENYSETATEDLFTTTYATSDEIAEAIWQRKLRYQANKKKKRKL